MKTKATATLLGAAAAILGGYAFHAYGQDDVKEKPQVKDPAVSKAAFREVYKVLMHPRCMNCHPAGNAPLQGDDSHPHAMNVTAGPEGKGIYAMKCANCHQHANLPGLNMPPGNPNWHLPPRDMPMVFEGKSPAELAALLKDQKKNGGKDFDQLMHHIAEDKLVLWGWDPGEGRTLPPLTHEEFAKQFRLWLDHGAEVPDE
ncbi:hypothetical protein OKA04_16250 [Luteolibacter flavescens]|uniref:Cytochrome c domain-containing protein n=1 Tax=Luteolibacter flavescens TaxID=1859460 RepID=A0ABT3FRT6_9BACT|nr:hypothetical protein [Luteolibacter flavescens]MCW1886290.1 hypothetical protein [Luteolibacter flavescens]